MIAVVLLVLLIVPTVVWFTVRRRPKDAARTEVAATGPKHHWWQP